MPKATQNQTKLRTPINQRKFERFTANLQTPNGSCASWTRVCWVLMVPQALHVLAWLLLQQQLVHHLWKMMHGQPLQLDLLIKKLRFSFWDWLKHQREITKPKPKVQYKHLTQAHLCSQMCYATSWNFGVSSQAFLLESSLWCLGSYHLWSWHLWTSTLGSSVPVYTNFKTQQQTTRVSTIQN